MELTEIDRMIHQCNLCGDKVEKFPNSKTVSMGKKNDIVILGEAPANNGWRKSGVAWHDVDGKLLPSGVVLQKLLSEFGLQIEDTCFLEAIKCFPKSRNDLTQCGENCRNFLLQQLSVIQPNVVIPLGDAATKLVLRKKYHKFSEVSGKVFETDGYTVIPFYHPSPISPMSYKGNMEIIQTMKQTGNVKVFQKAEKR